LSNTHGPSGSNISGGSTGKISQTVTSVRELDVLHRLKKRLRLDLDDLDQQPSGGQMASTEVADQWTLVAVGEIILRP
jgi:hypothetical protein